MMKVHTIRTDGLSRELEITIPAEEIQRRIEDRLRDVGRNTKLKGFRKGKIPRRILNHRYGPSVRGEVVERAVNETSWKVLRDQNIRPATKPRIDMTAFEDGMDLVYVIHVESMPGLDVSDLEGIRLTRLVAEPDSARLEEQLEQLRKNYLASPDSEDSPDSAAEDIDAGLARSLGAGNFEDLCTALEKEQQREMDLLSRLVLKRELFDHIDRIQAFRIPQGMTGLVDLEYQNIVRQVAAENQTTEEELELTGEEELEIQEIAERRVRLGMIVAEMGNRLKLSVSEQELQQAIAAEAQKYPGQEKEVKEHFANEPAALDSMRATVLEEKVIDHILDSAEITDQAVSGDELVKRLQDEV